MFFHAVNACVHYAVRGTTLRLVNAWRTWSAAQLLFDQ